MSIIREIKAAVSEKLFKRFFPKAAEENVKLYGLYVSKASQSNQVYVLGSDVNFVFYRYSNSLIERKLLKQVFFDHYRKIS